MRHLGKMTMLLAILSSLSIHVPAAKAQEKSEDECARLHPGIVSPVEMAACTFDIDGSNIWLTSAYGKLFAQVSSKYRNILQHSQRAWTAYRDAQCEFEASGHMGTMGSSDLIACAAEMNRTRAKYLEDDLDRWKQ